MLGMAYTGVDLRQEQVDDNIKTAAAIIKETPTPRWICGDSGNIAALAPGRYDFLLSCPPYYDLEQYSDDPADASNAPTYKAFLEQYRRIVAESVKLLKNDRFACFVVSEIRDQKTGWYRNFVSDTVAAFENAGAHYYNEVIVVRPYGSLPLRTPLLFERRRKVGRVHDSVLVFYKGDVERMHDKVLVFYKGDLGKIKRNYTEVTAADIEDAAPLEVKIDGNL